MGIPIVDIHGEVAPTRIMRLNFRLGKPGAIFNSFLGVLDIKLGAEIVLLFGVSSSSPVQGTPHKAHFLQLINKVAGLYGLITIFVGGSFTQLAFYAYSTASLFVLLWALKTVKSVSLAHTLPVSGVWLTL
jgi:hypothetical protein